MKASIVCSVFNCEKYIDEMIQSVLRQTYECWELIIIDDASTDGTLNRLYSYSDDRIKIYCNSVNAGQTSNLNKAINISRGEYIIRVDGDDVLMPDRLQTQIEYMESHPDVALSGGWACAFGDSNSILRTNLDSKRIKVKLLFGAALVHPTFIIRKSFIQNNSINYDESLKYAQDYAFEYDVACRGELSNVPKIMTWYRVHSNQVSTQYRDKQNYYADLTRKRILSDLGVSFNTSDMELWNKYCRLESYSEADFSRLDDLIDIVINAIKQSILFDCYVAERTLRFRRGLYYNICNTNKLNDIEEKKYKKYYTYLDYFGEVEKQKKAIIDAMVSSNVRTVAIYGTGFIGKRLYEFFNDSEIEVVYFIDKNVGDNYIDESIEIFTGIDSGQRVDMIIVSSFFYYEQIKKELSDVYTGYIISADAMISEIFNISSLEW